MSSSVTLREGNSGRLISHANFEFYSFSPSVNRTKSSMRGREGEGGTIDSRDDSEEFDEFSALSDNLIDIHFMHSGENYIAKHHHIYTSDLSHHSPTSPSSTSSATSPPLVVVRRSKRTVLGKYLRILFVN